MMKTVLLIVSASLLLAASSIFVSATKPSSDGLDVKIYAKGELWNVMSLTPDDPGRLTYRFAIYRVAKGQDFRTSDGAGIYAFQIIPQLSGDSVNVEILALLEDPNTVSEAHPL